MLAAVLPFRHLLACLCHQDDHEHRGSQIKETHVTHTYIEPMTSHKSQNVLCLGRRKREAETEIQKKNKTKECQPFSSDIAHSTIYT